MNIGTNPPGVPANSRISTDKPLLGAESSVHKLKGHTTMLLFEDLARARIQETEETRHRQRLAHLVVRHRRWSRLAEFASKRAKRVERKL
jgi:hypothetical protein